MSQQPFVLTNAPWREFSRRLDAKPRNLPRLCAVLNSPDVFDRAARKTGVHRTAFPGRGIRLRRSIETRRAGAGVKSVENLGLQTRQHSQEIGKV